MELSPPRTSDVEISENVPFAKMLLSDRVLAGLAKCGFVNPSPIQLRAIPIGCCGLGEYSKCFQELFRNVIWLNYICLLLLQQTWWWKQNPAPAKHWYSAHWFWRNINRALRCRNRWLSFLRAKYPSKLKPIWMISVRRVQVRDSKQFHDTINFDSNKYLFCRF